MRITILIGFLFVSFITLLTGCTDVAGTIAQSVRWRDRAQVIRADLDEQIAITHAQRGQTPDDSPRAERLDAELALAQDQSDALGAAIVQADRVIAEAQHPSDSLTHAARGLSAWVPAPVQGPLVLGAALIATMARSRQLKSSAASIIRSINHVMDRDEQFKALFEQHADTIRTIQTPMARRLVDRATPKGP